MTLTLMQEFDDINRLTANAQISPEDLVERLAKNPKLRDLWFNFISRERKRKWMAP